jgi:hypothetical protein
MDFHLVEPGCWLWFVFSLRRIKLKCLVVRPVSTNASFLLCGLGWSKKQKKSKAKKNASALGSGDDEYQLMGQVSTGSTGSTGAGTGTGTGAGTGAASPRQFDRNSLMPRSVSTLAAPLIKRKHSGPVRSAGSGNAIKTTTKGTSKSVRDDDLTRKLLDA